jgi:chorismate-pyruvate lyase
MPSTVAAMLTFSGSILFVCSPSRVRLASVVRYLREALAALFTLPLWLLPMSGLTESPSGSQPPANGVVTRLKAALLTETLNAELLSHDSATATLERWCATYSLAAPPTLVAERVLKVDKAPTEELRRDLRVGEADPVRYRRVRLRCGTLVLSEADNWYVPGRLTPEMNQRLDTTDAPFGRVVKSLAFQRHTISAKVVSPLLPQGWETMPPGRIEEMGEPCLPAQLLEHRALLTLPDGTPLSEVVETYTGNVLSMPALGLHHCRGFPGAIR